MKLIEACDEITFSKDLIHDISLKLIRGKLRWFVWKVNFSYKTVRGNKKENHRYVLGYDKDEIKLQFLTAMDELNADQPHRALLNVRILSIDFIGQVIKEID